MVVRQVQSRDTALILPAPLLDWVVAERPSRYWVILTRFFVAIPIVD
jgi:hypothetical protein